VARYASLSATVTLRLLCVCRTDRGRCLEYAAEFAGPSADAATEQATAAGWCLDWHRRLARCPTCTAVGRHYGPAEMDPIHLEETDRCHRPTTATPCRT
jgi:hypothetical protein